MEIKDLEIAVELAEVRGGSLNQSAPNFMSAHQTGPVTTVNGTQGGQLVNSAMTIGTTVTAPQSIQQHNAPALGVLNSGNLDASFSSSYEYDYDYRSFYASIFHI